MNFDLMSDNLCLSAWNQCALFVAKVLCTIGSVPLHWLSSSQLWQSYSCVLLDSLQLNSVGFFKNKYQQLQFWEYDVALYASYVHNCHWHI